MRYQPILESLEQRLVPDGVPPWLVQDDVAATQLCYQGLLGRTPRADEIDGWVNYRRAGMAADTQLALFAASPEYTATHPDWLTGLYTALLGREVDPVGRTAWTTQGPFVTALGITHSHEFTIRQDIDPITFANGDTLEAFGDWGLFVPWQSGQPIMSYFPRPDGTLEPVTVIPIESVVENLTHVRLFPAVGGDPIEVSLPTNPLGTGLEPTLALDTVSGVAYLVVPGNTADTGGPAGIVVFASVDGGHNFSLRGTIGGWLAGTPLHVRDVTAVDGVVTVHYTAVSNTTTWTSADPTPHTDAGPWVIVSSDSGWSWVGRGVRAD
jgi:hypothetical protein